MIPDELPQDATHADLLLRSQFLTRNGGIIIELFHLVLLKSHLNKLVAKVDEGDASSVVAAFHHQIDSVSQFLIVIEEMNGICIVIHNCSVLLMMQR